MTGTMQNAQEACLIQKINNASPLDLLIMAYDAALIGCNKQDLAHTTRALNELKNALDPTYDPQIALGLHRLDTYCQDLARQGSYDEAANLLRELCDTWIQVREQYRPAVAPAANPYGAATTPPPARTAPQLAGLTA
jgi:flagellin-specific chaperone FliS